MKPPNYNWCCHRCDAVNQAMTSICAKCDFPAVASAEEIATGIAAPPTPPLSFREQIVRTAVVCGLTLTVLGFALFFRVFFLTSIDGMAISASLAALGGVIAYVGWRLDPSDSR
ncbi:MAG: hypothetical protein ACRCWJ_05205 [Casimicrobium sp.]